MKYMLKNLSRFSLFAVLLFSLTSCFSEFNDGTEIAFSYIPGEVFVRIQPNTNFDNLQDMSDDLNVPINRSLGNGYILEVEEKFEPLWITSLLSESVIREADFNKYGFEYEIIQNDSMPRIDGDQLTIQIGYSGCDGGHVMSLETPGDFIRDMEIWLYKETPDQDCEAYFVEERTYTLTRFIQLADRLTIIDPFENRIVLWPIEEPELAN